MAEKKKKTAMEEYKESYAKLIRSTPTSELPKLFEESRNKHKKEMEKAGKGTPYFTDLPLVSGKK